MTRRKQHQWMAIVSLDQPDAVRPFVISDSNGDVYPFASVEAIKKFRTTNALQDGDWYAFNFVTGQIEEV